MKLFNKIATVIAGFSLALGVGVAATSLGKGFKEVKAAEQTVTWTATAGNNFGGAISSVNGTKTGTINTGSFAWNYTNTLTALASNKSDNASFQGSTWCQLGSNNASHSLVLTTSAIPGMIKTVRLYAASSGGSHNVVIQVGSTKYVGATTTTLPSYTGTAAADNPALADALTTGTGTSSGTIAITITPTARKALLLGKLEVVYDENSGGPSVSSVSLSGNMTTKSYTTVQSWSNAGLTATVNMSDSSTYSGDIDWAYAPTSPAAAVIANSNNEVTNLSVTATASAGGKSGEKATTGISVSYANVAQGLAAIPNANDQLDSVIVKGKISHINEIDTTQYYNATYFISDDGSRTNELEIYRGKGLNNANFTNANDIRVGDVVVVYGNLKYYNGSTKEFLQGNYLLKLDRPASSDPVITITESNFTAKVGDADVTLHATAENVPEGGSVKWVSGTPAVATINETTGVLHAVSVGSTVITAKIVNSSDETVASNSITVTVIQPVLNDGDSFVIYYGTAGNEIYFSGVEEDIGTYTSVESEAAVITATESATSGQFALSFGGVYLSYSGGSNKIYTSTENNSDATLWTATDNGTYVAIESVNVPGRYFKYNASSGSERFCCYTTATNVHIKKTVVADPTTLTLNTKSMSLDAGDSSAALTFTTDSPSAVFHWYSEDTNKATVANGVVTAVANSGTVKIYVYFDTNGNGQFDLGTDLSDYCTVTLTTPSIDYSAITYGGVGTKITSANSASLLVAGKKIILATSGDEPEVAGNYTSSKYYVGNTTSTTFDGATVTVGDGTTEITSLEIFELETATGGFYLKTKDGKYLSHTSQEDNTGDLKKLDEGAIWTITVDAEGAAEINGGNARSYIRVNFTNSENRFKTYATSTGSAPVLYSFEEYVDEAEAYAANFMNSGLCGTNDNTKADSSIWMAQRTAFLALSTGAQNVLKGATANADSTDNIQKCLARYDRVIYLHYTAEAAAYPDFMNRVSNNFVTPLQNPNLFGTHTNNNLVLVIVVASVSTISVLAFFVIIKRRKHN